MRKFHHSILKRINLVLRSQYTVVKRQKVYLLLNKNNWIDNRLLGWRKYERKNLRVLKALIKNNKIDAFFDIGANIGYFTVHIGKCTEIEKCYSFEPLRRNHNQLCANILLNDLNSKVQTYNVGLTDKREKLDIKYNSNSTGIATVVPDQTGRSENDYNESEEIKCERFDDLFALKGLAVLMKVDVEGAETRVLEGMNQFIENNKVVMMVEINHDTESTLEKFKEKGLRPIRLNADDYVLANSDSIS